MKTFIICFIENRWHSIDFETEEFSDNHNVSVDNQYYSFQVSDLIRSLKAKYTATTRVPEIINLESFDKQFSQKGKDLSYFKQWHILKSLRREEVIDSHYRISDLKDFLLKIKEYVQKLISDSRELARFESIEKPINKILHETSISGIRIDREILDKKCIKLHKEIYEIKNELQFSYNIFQPERFETQAKFLTDNNYRILESVQRTISLVQSSNEICKLFDKLNKYASDLKTLILLKSRFGGMEFINPYYIGFGTITSRIILKEPALQNLRKENRDIIVPNEGKGLFYIDYSQFEASILAHLSNDKKLLELVNNGDIYEDIITNIFLTENSEERRKDAKILFYRFLYGDKFENNNSFKIKVDNYFNAFKELANFKNKLIEKSNEEGLVYTDNGNYRLLDTENENVWILSHLIQSKASYIFKKAIIETYQKVRKARLLIPLHDGALYEIADEESEITKTSINKIFVNSFRSECPSLTNITAKEQCYYLPLEKTS